MSERMIGLEHQDLPNFLPNEEVYELIEEAQLGDVDSRNKLIVHNLRSVSWVVHKKFSNMHHSKDEMFSHGVLGLMNAIKGYKEEKGDFVNYSTMCIINGVLKYLQKCRRKDVERLASSDEEDVLTIIDSVDCKLDKGFSNFDDNLYVNSLIDELDERSQFIIRMYYGIGCKPIEQPEIARRLGLNQGWVSRLMSRSLKQLKEIAENV